MAEITEVFKQEGKQHLPVAVIQSGSTVDERVAVGKVDSIVTIVKELNISSPALLVFGEVVSLHPNFTNTKEFYDAIATK